MELSGFLKGETPKFWMPIPGYQDLTNPPRVELRELTPQRVKELQEEHSSPGYDGTQQVQVLNDDEFLAAYVDEAVSRWEHFEKDGKAIPCDAKMKSELLKKWPAYSRLINSLANGRIHASAAMKAGEKKNS